MQSAAALSSRNIALYPWFKFLQNLLFWQATWFLYFQSALSPAEAILLYVVYDMATLLLEVPSGYASDRFGRRLTLIIAGVATFLGALFLSIGGSFALFAAGQALLGAGMAFSSGTDSSLLYETLESAGRTEETEAQELRAWRFSFTALAVSAPLGGLMAYVSPTLPFAAGAVAALAVLALSLRFVEPPHNSVSEHIRLNALRAAFRLPVLRWLFVLSLLLYAYSHIPFVFGQPFIEQALEGMGFSAEAPLVSGTVATLMMLLSVAFSFLAPGLRARLGLPSTLLLGFGMQIVLAGALALSGSAWIILLLLARMIPDALTRPFIIARIQPLLDGSMRASYLSLQSLAGRLFFALTLWLASLRAEDGGPLSHEAMRDILGLYALFGIAALLALALRARKVPINPRQ